MTKSIEVVISPNGQTRIETRGYSGESCRDASRFLEEALGLRTAETSTAEAHQIAQQAAQQKSR
jgi:hypothetical protein